MRNSKITTRIPRRENYAPQTLLTIPLEIANKLRDKGVEFLAVIYNEETGVVECHPRSKMYE